MKKIILLTLSAIFVLNLQVVRAGDNTTDSTDIGDEECVITDDLF